MENNDILLPVLNAPYKQLDFHAHKILDAMDSLCLPSQLIITSDPDTFPAQVRNHPRARFVGPLDHEHLQTYWAESRAIYFPTRLESFGYPLAEARVNGLPIIAPDTQQSREIAGPALKGYLATDPRSLVRAVEAALTETVLPDPEPFNPKKYFDWLLGVAP
ncbi:glycosyltransferase [Pedococcus sp. 2YAF34]|uniref:glycosyltransferase n=1 Tax=Pedococcus sp. 2YAF34 TaxID=3233032 RepID=UPI003F9B9427